MITRFFKSPTMSPTSNTSNLIVCVPGKQPVHYVLKAETVDVGRSSKSRIRINEEWVSRTHFELKSDGNGHYTLHDSKSLNGARVNGISVAKTKLKHGDFILIGGRIPAHFMELPLGIDPDPLLFENNRGVAPIPELQGEGEVLATDETTPISESSARDKGPALLRSAKSALRTVIIQPIRAVAAML